jgi:hypothetical protein
MDLSPRPTRSSLTHNGHTPDRNPALQWAPDFILTNAVGCHGVSSWGSRCNSIETGASSSRCSAALRRARSSRVGPIVLWQPKTDERVISAYTRVHSPSKTGVNALNDALQPAREACARVISTLYACPALQGCSPWMILPAWRASMRRDRCRRPPDASLFPILPQPAGHAWRHIPCH